MKIDQEERLEMTRATLFEIIDGVAVRRRIDGSFER